MIIKVLVFVKHKMLVLEESAPDIAIIIAREGDK